MRYFRAVALLVPVLSLSGCGYIHFGRLPVDRRGDAALQQAYSDLALEQKILKQELVLARKETDSLRAALDRSGSPTGTSNADLVRQLEQTSKDLAKVRADYAKLRAERTAQAAEATTLAASDAATLRDENARLSRELAASRQESARLAEQLKASVGQTEQAQAAVAQLNADLLDQRQARERAEQATGALRAQLEAVMARAGRADDASQVPAPPPSSATAVGQTANPLAALQNAKSPPSGAVPMVEITTSLERVRAAAAARAAASTAAPVVNPTDPAASSTPLPSESARTYTVEPGDTLEKIAVKLYGAADQWGKIYAANSDALAAGQGLKPGMKLLVPEK